MIRIILTYDRYSAAETFAVVQIDVPTIGDHDVLVSKSADYRK
jgi:hypothetical protein